MSQVPNIQYTAVKALPVNEKGQVLVLRQNDPSISGHDKCHPPGGIVELGESLEEALVREVREELNLECSDIKLLTVAEWQAVQGDDVMQFVGIFYTCRLGEGEMKLQEEEVSEAVWVDLTNIDEVTILEPSLSVIRSYLESIVE